MLAFKSIREEKKEEREISRKKRVREKEKEEENALRTSVLSTRERKKSKIKETFNIERKARSVLLSTLTQQQVRRLGAQ